MINKGFTHLKASRPDHIYLLAGSSLLMLYLLQLLPSLHWDWLYQVQQGELYRQFTGYLLFSYLLLQCWPGIQRLRKVRFNTRKALDRHKIQGMFGPLVFYVHSIELGYAYQVVLAFVFLTNCIIGYLNPHALKLRNQVYLLSWTVLHISLAILSLALTLFHLFVVYYYA